jgi:hypothetical protein
MDAPEDRLKAVNEHMWSGFASRADIVAVCPHVRFVPIGDLSRCSNVLRGQSCDYSMISSARASSVGGTSSASALAVLELITSSNFVGS